MSGAVNTIQWPVGGFQWKPKWQSQLPVMRGVNAPASTDEGEKLLAEAFVLHEEHYLSLIHI